MSSKSSRSWKIWALILGIGIAYEFYSLADDADEDHPLTYYIRRVFALDNPKGVLYWLFFGFWVWLGVHFFVDRNRTTPKG